jgi:hypothetical protein
VTISSYPNNCQHAGSSGDNSPNYWTKSIVDSARNAIVSGDRNKCTQVQNNRICGTGNVINGYSNKIVGNGNRVGCQSRC